MPVENPSKASFANRSFLVVEDFEAMRGILRDLLQRCGAKRIDMAANDKEAMNALRRGKADVVVCDYHLGEGRNGQQLLEEARHAGLISAATIWIMVTAEKTSDMVMGAVEHSPDDYLLKPITEAALQSRLEKLIARKAALAGIAQAMRNREYRRAMELCRTRMEQDPGNPSEIQRIQCDLLRLAGQPEQARALYESILSRRDVAWARTGLARLHFQEGDSTRARDLLEQVIAEHRTYLEAYDWLARLYQKDGAWQEAERVLRQAVVLSPNSPQRQNALGESALNCEHLESAEQAYQKAMNLSTQSTLKNAAPYLGLARVYSAQNKPQEALRILGQVARDFEAEETKLQAKAAEIRVHHVAGDTAAAEAAASELSARIRSDAGDISPAATLEMAETLMLMGEKESASQLLQFVVRNNHEDQELAARVQAVFDKGDMGDAGRALMDASRREVADAMNQGVRLASQGKLDEALAWLRQARMLTPRNPRLLLNLAHVISVCLQKNGWRHDLEREARDSIETARLSTPDDKRIGELLTRLDALC